MTEAALLTRIDQLTSAVLTMARIQGTRLDRAQMAERLGIHRNTLARRMHEPGFPTPGRDGKWLLSEVIEWERLR
ncbi:MAG: helix-turn-helix transcriptional regulator [Burkholderiaceae bacterium]